MSHRARVVVPGLAVLSLVAAPAASAQRKVSFRATPAVVPISAGINVAWKVDRRLRKGEQFQVGVLVTPDPKYVGYDCTTLGGDVTKTVRKGRMLRVTISPQSGRFPGESFPYWCPGSASVVLRIVRANGDYEPIETFLAQRLLPVRIGPKETLSYTPTPVKITIRAGSTLTASAPGRPDRVTPVTGVLRGLTDRKFQPLIPVRVINLAGSLVAGSLADDPLCPGTSPAPALPVTADTSLVIPSRDPTLTLTLGLSGSPSQVFGCGPAGAFSGTTTMTLTGAIGSEGLLGAPVSGGITGIGLPGGSQGGLAANLLLGVDISGVVSG